MSSDSTPPDAAKAPDDARSRRLLVTLALGFASGLPLALSSGTLTYFLAKAGVDERAMGLFGLAALPYSYKFLWAPVLDHVAPGPLTFLGQRRGWLVLAQLGLVACILATGTTDPARTPLITAGAAFGIAFFSASQDVLIDALRVESLAERDQGWGAALTMWGYRLGMIASGYGALHLADHVPFRVVYSVMAGLAVLGSLGVWFAIDTRRVVARADGTLVEALAGAVIAPFRQLAARHPILLLAAFLVVFRLGDAWAGQLSNSYLVSVGFTGAEIANVTKLLGVVATVVGVGLGGLLVSRASAARLLPFAAIVMAFSNLAYAWLATRGHRVDALAITVVIEYATSGIGQAITVAWLSSLCDRAHTATQYALLTAMISVSRTSLVAFSGYVKTAADELVGVEGNGWSLYFAFTVLAGLPGIALAFVLARRSATPETSAVTLASSTDRA